MIQRFFALVILLSLALCTALPQVVTLSGTVRDASTNSPLPAANIRILGTSRGTVANVIGVYRLSLEKGEYTIIYSYIGYHSDTLHVMLDRSMDHSPRLKPTEIQMAEVVVTSEDPAMAIMRKVIEYKKRWTETLKSYEFDAFTRLIMRRDTSIAAITESYTTGYWQKGDTLREVVKQKRHTENIPGIAGIAVGGSVINFYEDDVNFSNFRFVGPTSAETFDYYDFKLVKTRLRDEVPVYVIRIIPKTRLAPLFQGELDVIGDTYALIGVDVAPNEAFQIPFISRMDLRYSQQFGFYENRYWMPMDVRLSGTFDIGFTGITLPRIGIEQASVLYDYKINRQLSDSIFKKGRVVQLPESQKFDSLFWAQHDVLPLTHEQQHAYKTLDSTQTLDKQFKPSGPLSALSSESLGYLGYFKIRFNRAEGLFLGLRHTADSLIKHMSLSGFAGYGFADKKPKFGLGASVFFDGTRRYGLQIEGYRELDHRPDEGYYQPFLISLAAVLSKSDYRDYYYTSGWRASFEAKPGGRLSLQLQYQNEDESTAIKRTDFSIFDRSKPFRTNPPVDDGTMRTLALKAHYGDDPAPFGLFTQNFAELEIEHSDPKILASAFDFTRIIVRGEARITTYSSRLLFPPALNLKLTAGASSGAPPSQRIFSLDSRYDGIGPFGVLRGAGLKEFTGRSFVSLSLEHNFRSTPFLILDIPYLYRNSIEVIAHGTVAQSWSSSPLPFGATTNGWYSEAGVGISRILTFFRVDCTFRFAQPRGVFFSIGVAQII